MSWDWLNWKLLTDTRLWKTIAKAAQRLRSATTPPQRTVLLFHGAAYDRLFLVHHGIPGKAALILRKK